jgi:hypothetical protein
MLIVSYLAITLVKTVLEKEMIETTNVWNVSMVTI